MGDEPVLSEAKGLLSVVLVTWNSARYLPRCLDGIRNQTSLEKGGEKGHEVELIAVDNGSDDLSVDLVAPHATHLIRNATNRGFSAAVNQALAAARGELILLLNPDCFLTAEYAARVAAALINAGDDYGCATGMLIRARADDFEPTAEIDSLGIEMTRSGRHLDLAQGKPIAGSPGDPFEVFGVSGAAGLYRARFLRDVALAGEIFDEDFFAYREDADLAWRGRLFGWRAICEPRAIAHHVRRVTPAVRRSLPVDVNMHSVKNRWLLRLKNEDAYLALRNAPFELARDLVVLAAILTVERTSLRALPWLWRNRGRILAKRREIQRRRRVSGRALARWFR